MYGWHLLFAYNWEHVVVAAGHHPDLAGCTYVFWFFLLLFFFNNKPVRSIPIFISYLFVLSSDNSCRNDALQHTHTHTDVPHTTNSRTQAKEALIFFFAVLLKLKTCLNLSVPDVIV